MNLRQAFSDEYDSQFNGPRGDFYKNMFAKSPAGRPARWPRASNVATLKVHD